MPQRVSASAQLPSRLHRSVAELRLHFRLALDAIVLLRVSGTRSLLTLVALAVASGLVPVASVVVTARVVDRLVPAVTAGGAEGTVMPLVLWALAAVALLALAQVVGTALRFASSRHEEESKRRITARIHEQSARLDLAFYESPELFDHLHRAREEASYRPAELCQAFVSLLKGSVTLVGLAAVILALGPWLLVFLLIGAAPVVYVAVIKALEGRRWGREAARAERRASYYDHALRSADFASELRIFGWAPRFQEEYATLQARLDGEQLALGRRHGKADLIAAAVSLVVLSGGGAWIVRQAILGVVSLGQLAGFGQAFATGLSTIRSWLDGLRQFYANSLFIEDLAEFLTMEPRIVSPKAPVSAPARLRHGIQFRNVTFHYPGTNVAALDRFTLHIPAGQRAAIVGPNGAGKSTIIKLLCRLYDPVEGTIEIDGVDIRQFDLTELRSLVSPLFQEPVRYYQSAWDNVTIGGVGPDVTPEQVKRASVAAGASAVITGLPRGYNTVLGKWFDEGTQLSSGEWQRIALARAIARPSPVVVLDEPTSALDPWMEAHWYPRFCEVAAGRTAVIITHRFTTAMMTDIIHVVDHGRVIESGSHTSLMTLRGRYAYAWTATHSIPEQPAAQVAS